jgi:hypothetical protein
MKSVFFLVAALTACCLVGCNDGGSTGPAGSAKLPEVGSPEAAQGGTVLSRDPMGDK